MICPKCGYEQQERLDCLKCGIVFSKFIAFHAPEKPSRPDPAESAQAGPLPPDDTLAFDASELRQQVRELSRRFNEVEFERVERGQLRNDLRALDRKSQSELEQLNLRLETLEKLINEPPPPPPVPTGPDYAEQIKDLKCAQVDPLVQRLDELERRFEEVVEVITQQPDPQIVSLLEKLDTRATALETQLAGIHVENDSKASVASTQDIRLCLQSLNSELDVLRVTSDQSVAAMQDIELRLQSLNSELDVLRATSDQGAAFGNQISELREQTDLTREKLQSLEDKLEHLSSAIHDAEQPRVPLEEDVHYIRESLDQIRQFMARINLKS